VTATTQITIDHRFCGPPQSGHGGYTAGLFATTLGPGPAEVRLRRPPPLDVPLDVVPTDDGAELRHGADVVATARPAQVDVEPIEPVTVAEATRAEDRFIWRDDHPFDTCFGCGTSRAVGDAWRTFGGETASGDAVASRAVPPGDLLDATGRVPAGQVWAALDCITAAALSVADAPLHPPWVLGTFAVDIRADVPASGLVVMAWPLELDGRKFRSAGALYADGVAVAVARATWIQLAE
jgi:hypothetical protein